MDGVENMLKTELYIVWRPTTQSLVEKRLFKIIEVLYIVEIL